MIVAHYAMWRTQLTWSISRVRCEVTSRLLKAIAMKTFSFKDNKKEAEKPRL